VLRFRLMVKRGPCVRPQASEGEAQHGAFSNVLSGFIEYSYYDFGTRELALTPQVAGLRQAFVDITESTNVVRVGLNVRFGGNAAPAAATR
jgi:hypothetical protein